MTCEDKSMTLSQLAKKNSTLTSLLTSSPKNENPAYRVTTSPRPLTNGKAAKSDEKASTLLQKGSGENKSSDERRISFSLFNHDKRKFETLSANGENEAKANGNGYSYFTTNDNENVKENCNDSESKRVIGNHDEVNPTSSKVSSSYLQAPRENGLTNGGTKMNGLMIGVNGDLSLIHI